MRVWIGTAGYSYAEWVGGFYPPATSSTRMLPWYAGTFPVVELSSTFHRCPTVGMMERLADQAPPGFRFSVRVPKSISHEQNDGEVDAFREAVAALRERLAMLVAQFPTTFHHSLRNCGWLNRLAGMFDEGAPLGVEFRHWSWARPDVPRWLEELGLQAISVDVPSIPTIYPRGLVRTGKRIY